MALLGGEKRGFNPKQLRVIEAQLGERPMGMPTKKNRPNARRRKQFRVVQLIDEVTICGVKLRRHLLPNGKRVFEEECIRELLLAATEQPTPHDVTRFDEFTRPEVRH